jgi:hypothetical protein
MGVFNFRNHRFKPIVIRSINDLIGRKIEPGSATGLVQEGRSWQTVYQALPTIDVTYEDLPEVKLKFGRGYKILVPLDIYIEKYKYSNLIISIGPIRSKPFIIANTKQITLCKNDEMVKSLKQIKAKEQYTSSNQSILTMMRAVFAVDPIKYHLISQDFNNLKENHIGYEIKENKLEINCTIDTDIHNGILFDLIFDTKYFNVNKFKQEVANIKRETSLQNIIKNCSLHELKWDSKTSDESKKILLFSHNYGALNEKRLNYSLYDIEHEEEYFSAQLICSTNSSNFNDEDAAKLFINILTNVANCF